MEKWASYIFFWFLFSEAAFPLLLLDNEESGSAASRPQPGLLGAVPVGLPTVQRALLPAGALGFLQPQEHPLPLGLPPDRREPGWPRQL